MENTNQFLGTERVESFHAALRRPCIISPTQAAHGNAANTVVGALYNIVDQIFIANASYRGSYGNAANTVVFPLTVVALAIAVMIGDGCCAFVSISLGKGEVGEARKSVGSAVAVDCECLVLTALYLGFADPIISMFGTVNEETFHYAQEYFFYISLGIPFYMFGQAMNPVIRADGNPRFAMISTLAGAVLNIILDPIFIFECKWGMMGAAVATVLGQIVISIVVGMAAGCIPVVGYNMGAGKKTRVRELFTKLLLCEAIVGAVALVLAEGFPRQLIAVFGAANESSYYTDFAIKAFRTYLCMMVLACVNKACFIFLQAVGKAFSSTMLSMVREVAFGVGFALLLPRFFGLDGVLYSMPVSDVLTFVIAAGMIVKTYRELNTEGATVL